MHKARIDGFVKTLKMPFSVISADTGSGPGQAPESSIFKPHKYSGLRFPRSDDFLRVHQNSAIENWVIFSAFSAPSAVNSFKP